MKVHCLLLWLIMFVLAFLTPLMTDNYLFSRIMTPGYADFMAGAPIEKLEPMTLQGAFEQSVRMYTTWCGRFLGNFCVYTTFLLPHAARAALSAALFVALCLLILLTIYGRQFCKNLAAKKLLFVAALLWVSMPSFGSAFFWISVGGVGAILAQLCFLLPYRFALDRPRIDLAWYWSLLFCILGFCTASMDYASSAAMPVAAFFACIWLFVRKKLPLKSLVFYVFGFFGVSVGAAVTLLAPGNSCRMQLTTDSDVHTWLAKSFFERIAEGLWHFPGALFLQFVPLILIAISIWSLYKRFGKHWYKHVPILCFFFLIPWITTHAAYFCTPWPPARAFATTTVQLIVIALCLFRIVRIDRIYTLLIFGYCIVSLPLAFRNFTLVYQANLERETLYVRSQGLDVRVPAMPVLGDRHMVLGSQLQDISYDPKHWVNRAVAAYWNLASVALAEDRSAQLFAKVEGIGDVYAQRIGNILDVRLLAKEKVDSEIAFYYAGYPALLASLPNPVAMGIVKILNGVRIPVGIPLLFARASSALTWSVREDGLYEGMCRILLWGVYPGANAFWLVTPGTSLDVVPLKEIGK